MTGISMWSLDDTILEQYIERFCSHGSYTASYWFIGMEFGGGGSVAQIVGPVQGRYERGGSELEGLSGPTGMAANSRWFKAPLPLPLAPRCNLPRRSSSADRS